MSQRTQIWDWALPMTERLAIRNGELSFRETPNSAWRSVIFDRGQFINVLDYGAVGDGSTDDTEAIQSAINYFSRSVDSNGNAAGGGRTGVVYLPDNKTYKISSTLNYYGNYSYSIYLVGGSRDPNNAGARILWAGASGGTMLKMHGASYSLVRDLSFDGGGLATKLIKVQPWKNNANVLVTGGTHCTFERVHLGNPAASAELLSFGDESEDSNSYQCDQMEINFCTFGGKAGELVSGSNCLTAGTGIAVYDGGNTKNYRVRGGVATHLSYFCNWNYGSGSLWVESVMLAEIGKTCFLVGSGGAATIQGVSVEGGHYNSNFLAGQVGTNLGRCTLIGNSVVMDCGPDDDVINWAGNLTSIGNEYINNRVTDVSKPKVLIDAQSANCAGTFMGDHFNGCTVGEFPPIYDRSGNNLVGIDPSNSYAQQPSVQISVYAKNCTGGSHTGGAAVKLRDVEGRGTSINSVQPALVPSTITKGAQGEVNVGRSKLTIPYTAVQTAGLTRTIELAVFVPKTRIKSLIMDPSTLFAGTAGAVTAKIGSSSGGDEYMLSATVSAGGSVKGLADADLGTNLKRANVVQGGYVPSWTGAGTMYVTFTSADGNLSNLSAGALDIYLELEAV